MAKILEEQYPELPGLTAEASARLDITVEDMRRRGIGVSGPAEAAVKKIVARSEVVDADLCNVVPAGLLVITWELALKVSGSSPTLRLMFEQTLSDMGTTCVQGDTHRLFSLYHALRKSEKDATESEQE